MSTTLTNGLKLPDKGSVDWYANMQNNYTILDGAVGTIAEHTSALSGKAPLVHTHTKSDVTDLLNSNFIPSSDMNYTLGSSDLRWKQIWAGGYKTKFNSIDFTDSTTTGSIQSWWVDTSEKNGTGFFGVGSIRSHSLGLNEEHFRIKNAGGKWADLYIQLGDNNQFTIGTAASSDVTNNGFKGKFTPLASFIPNANNSYDLGSSSYQWNNLYAKNYYYNGTAWGLDQANVWNTYQTIKGYYFGNEQSTNGRTCLYLTSNRDTVGQSGIYITKFRQNRSQGGFQPADLHYLAIDVLENSVRTNSALNLNITDWNNDVPNGAVLSSAFANAQLGSSSYKWKTLNGINPGALSLPSSDSADYIDLSSNLSTNAEYQYTAPYDGWLCLYVIVNEFYTENAVGLYRSDTSANSHQWAKSVTAAINLYKQNKYQGSVMLPVESGKKYICYISLNANTTIHNKLLFFYKNKGNV